MDQHILPHWEASWIWGSGEESPRNEWRCFRRTFTPQATVTRTTVRIAADSRYVLYINGRQVGRGPVRSWPFELAFDEYEIGHLLQPDQENVIAVLVMHYGISTFQYLRGRGGLLLQVEMPEEHETSALAITTDTSWKTAIHEGHDPSTSRISCQLAFVEVVDARAWDRAWVEPDYNDTGWEAAKVIGPAGMQPWTKLVERSIPHLTEQPLYPSRVESLSAVKSAAWSAVIDVRSQMVPESADHANVVEFCGYLATAVHLDQAAPFTIGIVDEGRIEYKISINGQSYEAESYTGEYPERYLMIDLQAGDHLILIDVTGGSHGHAFHLGFDCDASFKLHPPGFGNQGATDPSPFVVIGPFDTLEIIDHQPGRELKKDHPDYKQLRSVSSLDELQRFHSWIRPLDPQLINLNDVFTSCVWKKSEIAYPVPSAFQQAVIASTDAAVIPVYSEMDTEIVIDFGCELSGYVSFELDAADGTVIDGYGFEYMKDGWRQHTYLVDNTFRYICLEGRQSYTSVVRRGLRYLSFTIRGAKRPARLYEVKMIQSTYPVAEVGRFRSNDLLLNEIWTISRDTTRLCMEDTFVDCPAFEQAYWVGDARNEALVNYYAFGSREIVERCLKLVPGSVFQTPMYADQVPSGWNSVIPNWTFFWVTACLEYYRYDGNRAFLTDIWPRVKLTLSAYLSQLNKQGLFARHGWNLLDWAPFEQPRDGIVTPQNMFLVKALRDAAEIGTLAGDTNHAGKLNEQADKLSHAIDQQLWDHERSAYLDCIHADGKPSSTLSMQTQIVACLCDIASGDRKKLIEDYIVNPPASFVQVGSPFMSFFFYEALAKLGRLDIMVADMRKSYGFMIDNGATTCWEMYPWSGHNTNPKMLTRSHCHAWSAGPAYFLGAYVLGVQGLTAGWSKVEIAPHPCGLESASGSVPLPHEGRIDVSWRVTGEHQITLRVEAPEHVEIVTTAPEGYEMTVEYA
jgi:alpha-L-rhamnosidase